MTLDEAVGLFAKQNVPYATPFGASNMCVEASGEFLEFLVKRGVIEETPEEKAWFDEHGWEERPTFGIVLEFQPYDPAFTGNYYDFPYVEQAQACVRWHAINYVGDQCYDWTARQLWASAPFPLIWTPTCTSLRSMPPTRTATTTTSTPPSCPLPA